MFRFAVKTLLLLVLSTAAWSADITFKNGKSSKTFNGGELGQRPDATHVDIKQDIAYNKTMHYLAVPLAPLLRELQFSPADQINFVALDGFVAPLPAQLILQSKKSTAWLAIEANGARWPALSNKNDASAGPFYLVWTEPDGDGITQEQWPYQIATIELVPAIEKRYPILLPNKSVPENSPIRQGFEVFKKNCVACHKLSGGGESVVGPDLNKPHNPTDYFQLNYLKLLIRNPKQVRSWPDSKMPSFSNKTISDQELDGLIAYLQHMKK